MLELRVGNVFVDIIGDLKTSRWKEIEKLLSFRPQGFTFSPLYNRWIYRTDEETGKKVKVKRIWDGWKRQAWRNKTRTYFPTGLYSIVASYLKEENIPYRARDLREKPEQNTDFSLSEDFIERDYQSKVCEDAATQQRGIIQAATGAGKCIRYDSLVITDSGTLTFEELLNKELPKCDLDVGEYHKHKSVISTPDSENGTDISSHIYYDGLVKSIKVTTQSGFEICGTPSHRIKVLTSEGQQQWRCLQEIKKGDFCVVHKNQMLFGENDSLNSSDGYWIGLLIGDGCLTSKTTVRLTNEDEHIIRFAKTYCKKRGLKLHDKKHKTSEKCRELFIHNKKYREELYQIGCEYSLSIHKEVPLRIRQSPKKVVASFLRGLFESDGWVEDHAVCLATSSERLSVQVQVMLLNFGIVSTRHVKQTNCHPSYRISIYRDYIPIFVQHIGLDELGHKHRKLRQITKKMSIQPNSNLDVIPHQSHLIKNLKDIIRSKVGYHNVTKVFSQSGVSYGSIRSWIQSDRNPSRSSLRKFLSWSQDYECDESRDIIELLNNTCSDQFHYDAVATSKSEISRNYDFVVPCSQSFSAQGFVNHNTAICAGLIKRLQVSPFLFFVTSIDLAHQARTELQKFLRLNGSPFTVGQIGGGKIEFGDITVLTIQTAVRALGKKWDAKTKFDADDEDDQTPVQKYREDIRALLHDAKGAICDEVQHWRADTCQLVTRSLPNCFFIYGTSATPYRDEGDDMMIQGCFGKKVAEITASELITTIDPSTGKPFLMKPYIKMVHLRGKRSLYQQWQSVYKDQVVENEFYNNAIANIANAYIGQDRLVLILVTQVKHGKYLEMMVPGGHFLSGNSPKKKRIDAIDKLRNKDIKCIISTVIFDEGIDVKPLDTLILAGQGKSKVRAMQRIGRVIRPDKDKPFPTVIDFHLHQKYLADHAKARAQMYSTEPEFDIEHIDPNPKKIFS